MKIVLCVLWVAMCCLSCQKANENKKNPVTFLEGKWELRKVQAGMSPEVNFKPGNGTRLEFKDSTYKRFEKGILSMTGHYSLVADNTAMQETGLVLTPGEFDKRVIFDKDDTSSKIFLNISGEELTLLSGFFPVDGGTKTIYSRE